MRKRNKMFLLFVPAIIAFSLSTEAYAQTKTADVPYFPSRAVQNIAISKSPFADIIKWRYKSVNKRLYRRQYNYSKQKWVGEWEAC